MQTLDVFFSGWGQHWKLGKLASNRVDILFEYSPEALRQGLELSPRRLKLRADTYSDFPAHQYRLPGIIADALPDGWGMLLMDRLLARQGVDLRQLSSLDRLAVIGERAMGALSFQPASDLVLTLVDMQLLELAREACTVLADRDSVALKALMLLGGSPQGARPKVLVQFDPSSKLISTHDTGVGTPWLIKFPAANEHKEVAAIEHLYAHLARECGLDMPATHHFDLDKSHAAFGIERFDWHHGMRVPVHTLAGTLDADFHLPATGYQTFLRNTRLQTHSEYEVEKAFARCVFNVVFNNRDDHVKNFAYRMDETLSWKLAPCYDLTFSDGPGGEHHMDVEGEGRAPARQHLLSLASKAGVRASVAADTIERIAMVAGDFSALVKACPIRSVTCAKMSRAIAANRQRM